jgi:hypothetical protein
MDTQDLRRAYAEFLDSARQHRFQPPAALAPATEHARVEPASVT